MTEVSYKIWNRSFGLIIFLVALITFSLTVEPTASFWDAGEYISTSAKLQIGHPPGAPFYQMLGAFFALFSFSGSASPYDSSKTTTSMPPTRSEAKL